VESRTVVLGGRLLADRGTDLADLAAGSRRDVISPSVLHVTTQVSDQGGAEVSLVQFLAHLQGLGVRNTVLPLFSRRTSARIPDLRDHGVRVLDPPDGGLVRHTRTVRRLHRDLRPDIVHSSIWDADLAARLASIGSGAVRVVSLVNTPYAPEAFAVAPSPRRLAAYRRLEGVLARHLTDAFHALTDTVADAAVSSLGIDRSRIRVIPRGRDRRVLGEPSARRRMEGRERLGLSLGAEVVLNVARHEPQKGLIHLVRAFAEVAAARPRAVLIQAGRQGSATPELGTEIERLKLGPRIRLLGRRTDVGDLLAASDVFAFSSLWEGLGGAVLEAMAMEVPVVTFAVPAVREILGGHGLISAMGDESGFAENLLRVLDGRERASATASAARARFDKHYTVETVAMRMAEFYRELLGKR
jgi:glycosyltransferase involved in cell wall biosynthesis